MGQKNLAVLMGDHINKGFFTRKCMAISPGGQIKVGIITRWLYYQLLETVLKVHVRDENPKLMNLMNLLSYIHV